MKRIWTVLLTIMMLLSACISQDLEPATPKDIASTLTVFAAASLTEAFSEIGTDFEAANPGVTVQFNFAGSQSLRTQIEQGAQADVFASANATEMDTLAAENFIAANDIKVFLTNQLIVIMPANNSAGLSRLEDLARPGLKLVLAAGEVPAGNYALQVIDHLDQAFGAGFRDRVLKNVVSYENNVKQVVAKVQLGEADAGMVYSSDAVAAPELQKLDIPAENNVLARYPLAVLEQAQSPALARKFVNYVLSPEGQAILQSWGFLPIR